MEKGRRGGERRAVDQVYKVTIVAGCVLLEVPATSKFMLMEKKSLSVSCVTRPDGNID